VVGAVNGGADQDRALIVRRAGATHIPRVARPG